MRDIFAGIGFNLPETGSSGKGLENYSPVKIEGFSPSMKLVLNILENHGPLTQKEITKVTRLPTRTVRYALNRLKQEDILEEREYFQDARQCLYQIKWFLKNLFQVIIAFVFLKNEWIYQLLLIYSI